MLGWGGVGWGGDGNVLSIVLRDLAFVVIFSCSFNLFLVLVVFHVSFSRRVLALCPSSLLFFRFLLPFPSLLIVLGYLCFILVIPCFFFSPLSFCLFLLCPFFVASCSFSWVSAFFLLPFFPAFLLSLACSCSFPCHSSLQRSPCWSLRPSSL